MGRRFVLLDCDGTLIVDRHYLADPREVELLPGVAAGLRQLRQLGLGLAVITNKLLFVEALLSHFGLGKIPAALISFLNRLRDNIHTRRGKGKECLFISKKPLTMGGGSNTFAWHFSRWARQNDYPIVTQIHNAQRAIIIAHFGEIEDVEKAKARGCYLIHRIDEYFEQTDDLARQQKHNKIIALNKYADITVFQSQFVLENAYSTIQPRRFRVILNGGDPRVFYPSRGITEFIGHVTWSVANRKRLDILYETILRYPEHRFLLVGRHSESSYNFRLPNVTLCGVKNRNHIAKEYRRMKILFFPSENEPCPNTPIEAILSGVPVCFNNSGGTSEVVRDCGEPLERFDNLLGNLEYYRQRCMQRQDLIFERVFQEYMAL